MTATDALDRLRRFLSEDLWRVDLRESRLFTWSVRALQLVVLVGEGFVRDRVLLRATALAYVTSLALTRLRRADAAAMVTGVSEKPLPDDILDQIVVHGAVHALQSEICDDRRDTAVHERGAINHNHQWFFEQPSAVMPLCAQRAPVAKKTGRREIVVAFPQDQVIRTADVSLLVALEPSLALFFGLVAGKCRIFSLCDVS